VEELTHGEFAGVRIGPECRVELTIAQTESGGVRLVFQAELIDEHRWIDPPEGTDFSDIMVGALAEQVDADLEVERRGPGEPRRCIISLPPEVQQPSRLIHGPDELDDWSGMGAM
jgi:hypothetical protein